MSWTRSIFPLLPIVVFVCVVGCSPDNGMDPDPIKDWKNQGLVKNINVPAEIAADCLAYMGELPPDERQVAETMFHGQILNIFYLGDGTGQHAVKIEIPMKGTHWVHVLIYDKSNKRTKTMKYRNGRYAC